MYVFICVCLTRRRNSTNTGQVLNRPGPRWRPHTVTQLSDDQKADSLQELDVKVQVSEFESVYW